MANSFPVLILKEHRFGPSETIHGVIKLFNRHDMSDEEVKQMMVYYNDFNQNKVPRTGDTVKIPVLTYPDN